MKHKCSNYHFKHLFKLFYKFSQLKYKFTYILSSILIIWVSINTITLFFASSKSIDAYFVLGGSITREVYAAQLAQKYPDIPILISKGSQDPCIFLIFNQKQFKTPKLENVWLEKCANSTFDNFYYGIPILRSWKVSRVKMITSPTHLPRAKWMAQIMLGARGIWVDTETVVEKGIPGNQEHWLKTGLDLTRSILWAIASHFIKPKCTKITKLIDVDMKSWTVKGFKCEYQKNLNLQDSNLLK